ncbi:alpha-ketoglutarate-dependent dioxygenase AlkB [Micrococcus sp.]|uniref:alpha-ketoglutarate-dependent dioxygenase AlkB n=1 Tax=Micrococcus sp. TaxID=1271 RepID=UPI002A9148EB|nr:alpha-ketoglutarate-dependent dioxygenase AlkB [Micrococcus sp.]MDY6054269.1 alpha-ketoglutarate-dependent dioxygenase AlkB [Micrococcus sp.]
MEPLFGDDVLPRPAVALPEGAHHVPGFLSLEQQRWIVERFDEWAAGPVPLHSTVIGTHSMSVRTVCLGWHWHAGGYSREAVDVNGRRVLEVPGWVVRLGRAALDAVGDPHAGRYTPDAVLANLYDAQAHMGLHQDRDEQSLAPVVSLSIGDACRFRIGTPQTRARPHWDLELRSGDLFVFGGPSRLAFHGVRSVLPGTAPQGCGLSGHRLNLTLRMTGLSD